MGFVYFHFSSIRLMNYWVTFYEPQAGIVRTLKTTQFSTILQELTV